MSSGISGEDLGLLANLMSRSRFGATRQELQSYPNYIQDRQIAKNLHIGKPFSGPRGIKVDSQRRVFVVDCHRGRIQVYRKAP